MEALKCPVCEGKQTVPDGFYGLYHEGVDRIECRSCNGKGYVVAPEPTSAPVLWPYPVYTYYPVYLWPPYTTRPHWIDVTWGGTTGNITLSGGAQATSGAEFIATSTCQFVQ